MRQSAIHSIINALLEDTWLLVVINNNHNLWKKGCSLSFIGETPSKYMYNVWLNFLFDTEGNVWSTELKKINYEKKNQILSVT